jgi:alpha-L-arabinofuranosidase
MKPAFFRFPGGCYVEGGVLAEAFRWKDSIGDIAERPGHFNIWQHTRSNDGLGYHEYLQMSEDLGAEPLFVINCGMAHGDHVPMDQMGPWVQDALDAIEYANGPVESKWGALRAKAGHPKPFNLKYMEIGNENGGPLYQERYVLFYDAIKAKYPEMNLVADQMTEKRPTEINDEHYYSDPFFFIRNAGKYDSYDRKGPKIYVGEYAVTGGAGKGNLIAALGEAAFMTGMERNSDVVIMASYAPLFVNDGWRMWNPDAIVFNCAEVYGTPSYHVQAMFGKNRADVVLPVEIDSPPIEQEIPTGYVGVGSWRTQAEYRDIKVTEGDKVVFESDFTKGTDGWRTRGDWKVEDGSLRYEGRGEGDRAVFTGGKWQDFTLSLKARKISGDEGFLIIFRAREEESRSWWNIGGWGNSQHALELPFGGGGRRIPGKIETGRWYDIKIECKGPSISCYLDGRLVEEMSTKDAAMKSLYAVAGKTDRSGEIILKVVNVSGQPCDTEIELLGIAKVDSKATASVLASVSAEAENSFAEPTKVAPKEEVVQGVSPKFRRTFPALSVTVLRLKQAGK